MTRNGAQMTDISKISITYNDRKVTLSLIYNLVYFLIGLGLYFCIPHSTLSEIGAILSVIFFGPLVISKIIKLLYPKSVLIIDQEGITILEKFIEWNNITQIETSKNSPIFIIHLKNSIQYIESETKKWKKELLLRKQKKYGSPAIISYNDLNINFNRLKEILRSSLQNSQVSVSRA